MSWIRKTSTSCSCSPPRLQSTGSWDNAAAWLDQVPEDARGPRELELAWRIYTGLGDHDKALASAQRLFRATSDPHALTLEVRSMTAVGRPRDALVLIDHQLLTRENPAPLASELHYLRSQAGSDDPLRDLRTALVENPDNSEALQAISDALAAQKDYRKAMEYARRAAALSPGDAALAQKAADLQKLAAGSPAPTPPADSAPTAPADSAPTAPADSAPTAPADSAPTAPADSASE